MKEKIEQAAKAYAKNLSEIQSFGQINKMRCFTFAYVAFKEGAYFVLNSDKDDITENRNHLRQLLIEAQQDVKTFQDGMEERNEQVNYWKTKFEELEKENGKLERTISLMNQRHVDPDAY